MSNAMRNTLLEKLDQLYLFNRLASMEPEIFVQLDWNTVWKWQVKLLDDCRHIASKYALDIGIVDDDDDDAVSAMESFSLATRKEDELPF